MNRSLDNYQGSSQKLIRRLRRLIGEGDWTQTATVKIGSAALTLLLNSAKISSEIDAPAFEYIVKASPDGKGALKKVSRVSFVDEVYYSLSSASVVDQHPSLIFPRYLPMLIPPIRWDNKKRQSSCYLKLKSKLIRTNSNEQVNAVNLANIDSMVDVLSYVGSVPWRINKPVLEVIESCYRAGDLVGELPRKSNYPLPLESEAIRIPKKPVIFEKTNEYMRARFNELFEKYPHDHSYWTTPSFDAKYYKEMVALVTKKNAELHSLRADMDLKVWTAKKFVDDVFYYPFSLDFRGRAYPIPPNLNHLGSDLCRGLLMFEIAKPLGASGLDWLKLHLANLCGKNKTGKIARIAWVDKHLDQVVASAQNPTGTEFGCGWWKDQEEPFQVLATCIEIHQAIISGDPAKYMCRLPVHQDGSCNGLQHYAALGRDLNGGIAVNLTPSDAPQDVYSKVLEIVHKKLEEDALISPEDSDPLQRSRGDKARLVKEYVDRKVIKQTVMTSVYGVTRRGAAVQVANRLSEKLPEGDKFSVERDKLSMTLGV